MFPHWRLPGGYVRSARARPRASHTAAELAPILAAGQAIPPDRSTAKSRPPTTSDFDPPRSSRQDDSHRHVRLELPALGGGPVSPRAPPSAASRSLPPPLPQRRAQRELLPLANGRRVWILEAEAAPGLRSRRQGAPGPHPSAPTLRPRGLGRSHPTWSRPAGSRAGTAARSALATVRDRSRATRLLPPMRRSRSPGRGRDAPSELASGADVRALGAPPRGLLRHERSRASLRASRDGSDRVRQVTWARPGCAVCRLVRGRRSSLVGRSRARVGGPGP